MATSFGTGAGGGVSTDKNMAARAAVAEELRAGQERGGAAQPGWSEARPRRRRRRPASASHANDKSARAARASRGVSVPRLFTRPGVDPLENGAPGLNTVTGEPTELVYERRSSVITNPDGSVVFKMEGAEIPSTWSQLATDIVVSKYFRKAGPPRRREAGRDAACARSSTASRTPSATPASSFGGYFATEGDADAFEAELSYLLVHQIGAFNSPVWFNCGLCHEYGIERLRRQLRLGLPSASAATVVETDERLRAPAVLGVLHPGRRTTT